MGAARQSVKDPDPGRGMRMEVGLGLCLVSFAMEMDVGMALSVVRVCVGVKPEEKDLSETPEPYADQNDPHQPLAPRGERFQWKQPTEQKCQGPNQPDTGGVPDSPGEAGDPRSATAFYGQGGNRSQMVRPRQHVYQTGEEPRGGGEYHRRHRELICIPGPGLVSARMVEVRAG